MGEPITFKLLVKENIEERIKELDLCSRKLKSMFNIMGDDNIKETLHCVQNALLILKNAMEE